MTCRLPVYIAREAVNILYMNLLRPNKQFERFILQISENRTDSGKWFSFLESFSTELNYFKTSDSNADCSDKESIQGVKGKCAF